jgi:hypothetical protein
MTFYGQILYPALGNNWIYEMYYNNNNNNKNNPQQRLSWQVPREHWQSSSRYVVPQPDGCNHNELSDYMSLRDAKQ